MNNSVLVRKVIFPACIFILAGVTFYSCTYNKAELKVDCVLPATASFNNDVMPIINAQCNGVGCHNGATNAGHLNLEPSVAYSQLTHAGSGYIDTLNPTASILYGSLISASNVMPPAGKLDDCKIKLVLDWIQQKAKNN